MCGINDDRIQRRLLSETDDRLTLARAIEVAITMETAAKDIAELQHTGVEGPIHKVQLQPVAPKRRPPSAGCYRCGGNHGPADCRFIDAVCHNCQRRGHLARKCRSPRQVRQPRKNLGNGLGATHILEYEEEDYTHNLYNLDDGERVEPYREQVSVNGHDIDSEVDTGAGMTIINEETYTKMGGGPLHQTKIKLYTYTRDRVGVLGKMHAQVTYKGQTKKLALLVVKGEGLNLMGRNWLKAMRLDWRAIFRLQIGQQQQLNALLAQHEDVFKGELGTLVGATSKIYVDQGFR